MYIFGAPIESEGPGTIPSRKAWHPPPLLEGEGGRLVAPPIGLVWYLLISSKAHAPRGLDNFVDFGQIPLIAIGRAENRRKSRSDPDW